MKGDPLATFANARKSFWLTQGLEPATVGFPLNRLISVPKTTYSELCGLIFFKKNRKKPSHCNSRTLFSQDKCFDFDLPSIWGITLSKQLSNQGRRWDNYINLMISRFTSVHEDRHFTANFENGRKWPIIETGQNSRLSKRDKIDFWNGNKIADYFFTGQVISAIIRDNWHRKNTKYVTKTAMCWTKMPWVFRKIGYLTPDTIWFYLSQV